VASPLLDAEKAKAVAGVRLVAAISSGLAVVADDTWSAFQGREALEPTIVWDEGEKCRRLLRRVPGAAVLSERAHRRNAQEGGDVEAALRSSARSLEAEYVYPFQAHAPLEPMCALADVGAGAARSGSGRSIPTARRTKPPRRSRSRRRP
jgi:isoquinoline 1-oxidoreductase beta subunit